MITQRLFSTAKLCLLTSGARVKLNFNSKLARTMGIITLANSLPAQSLGPATVWRLRDLQGVGSGAYLRIGVLTCILALRCSGGSLTRTHKLSRFALYTKMRRAFSRISTHRTLWEAVLLHLGTSRML